MICLTLEMSAEREGPSPRLSIIRSVPDFKGYGFNLQAEQGRKGHFIGRVDAGSPAEAAGLRSGDNIIEVNDVNVQSDSHTEVVQRIRSMSGKVKFLAIRPEEEQYYKTRGIRISHRMSNIIVGDTEDRVSSRTDTSVISSSEADEVSESGRDGSEVIGEKTLHSDSTNSHRLSAPRIWVFYINSVGKTRSYSRQ